MVPAGFALCLLSYDIVVVYKATVSPSVPTATSRKQHRPSGNFDRVDIPIATPTSLPQAKTIATTATITPTHSGRKSIFAVKTLQKPNQSMGFLETKFPKVFGVADSKSEVKFEKYNMAVKIRPEKNWKMKKSTSGPGIWGLSGSLIVNTRSDFQNLYERTLCDSPRARNCLILLHLGELRSRRSATLESCSNIHMNL